MTTTFPFKPARPWQSHPRETATFVLLGCAAALALVSIGAATPTLGDLARDASKLAPLAEAAPTSPSATELRDVAPDQAIALNAQIPVAVGPLTAATPFSLAKANAAASGQAVECLTSAIYYEAGQESDSGQRAVAQVILNRVRHPAYPSSVCGVVYQGSTRVTGCQFTFTCDGSLARAPMATAWKRARIVAEQALTGSVFAAVGLATHYHANYVVPYWASSLVKTHVEGAHIFYRWSGNWGRAAAFSQAYAAREADARILRQAALAVPHVLPKAMTATTEIAAAKLDKIAGVEVAQDGKRVAVQFNLKARAAVEAIKLTPYVDRVAASDNLRRALDGTAPQGVATKPFGPPIEAMSKTADATE
ncbi:MAG TPA: cell wall hydrolase [Sphingomicrobium sp.]|nr:cell wall hydrolase [Sphingomicrobium sp.]